ncbi:VCBS repeat-containing protein [Streptomyces sp. NPDC003300]|uniref:FG-GAP repeat domain-containing protein n=1 Tax=unclassified Streptomyces TaxID=2593676 RepID=UPI0033AFEE98
MSLPPVAAADAPPSGPAIAVGDAHIAMYGEPGDLDVTVTAPPAADAYIRLDLQDSGLDQLRVTDDTGNAVPVVRRPGLAATVTIGDTDSDHNGIPGAPLQAGTVHLHVSAGYPIAEAIPVTGSIIAGSDGKVVAHSTIATNGGIFIAQPHLSASWTSASGTQVPWGAAVPIATGDTRATTATVRTRRVGTAPAASSTRWTLPADAITAAGYTARQLAAGLHVAYATDGTAFRTASWSITDDGSLTLQLPAHQWDATADGELLERLEVTSDWGLPAGTLDGRLETIGADGRPYDSAATRLTLTADTVPAGHRAAFYGRDSAGTLWQYQATPDPAAPGKLGPRTRVGPGWNTYTTIAPLGSLTAAGTGDLVARDHDGVLWYYRGTGKSGGPFSARTRVGSGWNTYTTIVGAGDVNGDGHPDLIARDHNGTLWYYRSTGDAKAPFARRTLVGPGWNTYTTIVGAGDVNGDGHPDLIARDHNGTLWYYGGTGRTTDPYTRRTQVGPGWNTYSRIVGVGDMTGDGHPDLLAADSAGKLWYYRGTGDPKAPYARRVQVGTGWNMYSVLL